MPQRLPHFYVNVKDQRGFFNYFHQFTVGKNPEKSLFLFSSPEWSLTQEYPGKMKQTYFQKKKTLAFSLWGITVKQLSAHFIFHVYFFFCIFRWHSIIYLENRQIYFQKKKERDDGSLDGTIFHKKEKHSRKLSPKNQGKNPNSKV